MGRGWIIWLKSITADPLLAVSPPEKLGVQSQGGGEMTLSRHSGCLPNHQTLFRLNKEDRKAKEAEIGIQVFL